MLHQIFNCFSVRQLSENLLITRVILTGPAPMLSTKHDAGAQNVRSVLTQNGNPIEHAALSIIYFQVVAAAAVSISTVRVILVIR